MLARLPPVETTAGHSDYSRLSEQVELVNASAGMLS